MGYPTADFQQTVFRSSGVTRSRQLSAEICARRPKQGSERTIDSIECQFGQVGIMLRGNGRLAVFDELQRRFKSSVKFCFAWHVKIQNEEQAGCIINAWRAAPDKRIDLGRESCVWS